MLQLVEAYNNINTWTLQPCGVKPPPLHSVWIYGAACREAHNKQLQHVIHTAGIIQGLRSVLQHPFEYVIMTTSNIVHLSIISISTTAAHHGVLPALC